MRPGHFSGTKLFDQFLDILVQPLNVSTQGDLLVEIINCTVRLGSVQKVVGAGYRAHRECVNEQEIYIPELLELTTDVDHETY